MRITVGGMTFTARFEDAAAPKTCAKVRSMLSLKTRIIQARWSGESAWIPFGELDLDLGYENHTSHPAPGQRLLYPGRTRAPEHGRRPAGRLLPRRAQGGVSWR